MRQRLHLWHDDVVGSLYVLVYNRLASVHMIGLGDHALLQMHSVISRMFVDGRLENLIKLGLDTFRVHIRYDG